MFNESDNIEKESLNKLYKNRFSTINDENSCVTTINKKNAVWKILCRNYFQKFISCDDIVLDIAAGYCDFSNNIEAKKIYAMDLNPDVRKYAVEDIEIVLGNIDKIEDFFEDNSISVAFMSNFLEHISKSQISTLFQQLYKTLNSDGKLIIMTPNIRYVKGKYWDFWDHITPITENAIIEVLELNGFEIVKCQKRFIPYSTKGHLPQNAWIVWLYLKLMPFSSFFFGDQSVIVAKKIM